MNSFAPISSAGVDLQPVPRHVRPVESITVKDIKRKYKFLNHVEEGLVFQPEDYVYSSAADNAGENGLLNDFVIKNCIACSIGTDYESSPTGRDSAAARLHRIASFV